MELVYAYTLVDSEIFVSNLGILGISSNNNMGIFQTLEVLLRVNLCFTCVCAFAYWCVICLNFTDFILN